MKFLPRFSRSFSPSLTLKKKFVTNRFKCPLDNKDLLKYFESKRRISLNKNDGILSNHCVAKCGNIFDNIYFSLSLFFHTFHQYRYYYYCVYGCNPFIIQYFHQYFEDSQEKSCL